MRCIVIVVQLLIYFNGSCQAFGGFGYEVLVEKLEYLDEKLTKFQNETIRQQEQHHRKTVQQNGKILQIVNEIYHHMEPIDSCDAVGESGRYTLKVSNEIFKVYCEQELYGGGWIVIQNRFDGSVDFYRNWTEYRNGFGTLDGEFWLGLQKIYWLTSSRNYELLVHLEDYDNVVAHARYQQFAIGSDNEHYVLKTLGSYSGTAGDSLRDDSNGESFSTHDQDNDESRVNCARDHHGAWWYYRCTNSNLNGKYQNADDSKGIYWYDFREYLGLKVSKIMIRHV